MIELRAACSPGEVRVAAVDGERLLDFAIWRPGMPDGVGDIVLGRLIAAVPAMAGAFVALGDAEGFLPDSEGAKGLTAGSILPVRITRSAQGGKGPRLTARIGDAPGQRLWPTAMADTGGSLHRAHADPSRLGVGWLAAPVGSTQGVATPQGIAADPSRPGSYRPAAALAPALLQRGPDPLSELAARYPDAPVLLDDRGLLATLRPALGDRARFTAAAFEDTHLAAIEALESTDVTLPNGARLSIHPTPALVAIDVDAGSSLDGGRGKAVHHAALNQAVLPALAEQIRLRNLSGAIVVDLAGLSVRKRAALGPALAEALAGDPLGPRFLGFTALGLAEIVRPRGRPPLHELLTGPHAAGLAALRAIAAGIDPDPRRLPVLRASPPVIEALQRDPVALPALAQRAGRVLTLRPDPSMPALGWMTEYVNG